MNRLQQTYLLITMLLLGACATSTTSDRPLLSVSIEPLRYLAEEITGDSYEINVLVPPGASPETYEPTAKQMRAVAKSEAYIYIGLLDFEVNLTKGIAKNMPSLSPIALSSDMVLIGGTCNHHHHAAATHVHTGADPHIWTSPRSLKVMAHTLCESLSLESPDSLKYRGNYLRFCNKMDSIDQQLTALFEHGNRHFMIFHPSLGYLARDYALTQIAIEVEGKEPSANLLRELIGTAKARNINKILYSSESSYSTVESLSKELEIPAVEIEPLGYEIEHNIVKISTLIAEE